MPLNNKQITVPIGVSVHLATTSYGDPITLVNIGPGVLYLGDNLPVDNTNGLPIAAATATATGVNSRIELKDYQGQVWGYAQGGNCVVALIENTPG